MKKAPANPTSHKRPSRRARELSTGPADRDESLATLDLPPTLFKEPEAPSSARRRRPSAKKAANGSAGSHETRPLRVLLIEDDEGTEDAALEKLGEGFSMRSAPSV